MTELSKVVFLNMSEEQAATFSHDFRRARCVIETEAAAEFAVILAGEPTIPEAIRDDLMIILIVESPNHLALLGRHLGLGADGILTLPLRRHDIETQLLLARQNRRLKLILDHKIQRLEASLRHRRHIERAVETIVLRNKLNRIQAFELLRRSAMDHRLPIWVYAEILLAGSHPDGDTHLA